MSYIVACFFELVLFMIVPCDLPVNYYCVWCHSEGAFHYKAHFVMKLISLGFHNEHYNEVAV